MMGSGKSHWAQRIAENTNMDWIDLDQQIEKDTSMAIREIFAATEKTFSGKKKKMHCGSYRITIT